MYVTPERKYCDVKSEKEIFDLRNVVVIIVAWLDRKMYYLRF